MMLNYKRSDESRHLGAGGSGVAFHSGIPPPSALRELRDALSRANADFLSSTMSKHAPSPTRGRREVL